MAGDITERSDWQDRAKGIGIILVVYGHVMRGLIAAGIMPDDAVTRALDYTLYTFHMPLFFLLSGLNVEASLARGKARFLKIRLWTVLWPYVLWSLLQGALQVSLGSALNSPLHWSNLAEIGWAPYAQFWFLYALMLCHITVLVLGLRLPLLVGFAGVGCVASIYLPFLAHMFLFNLVFYVAGIVAARRLPMGLPDGWGAFACAALSFMACATLNLMAGGSYDSPGAIPAAFCGIAMVILLAKALRNSLAAMLSVIGTMSMTIYILHILAAAGTRVVLAKLGVPYPALYLVCGTLLGVSLPIVAHMVFQRLGLLPWLGLGRPPQRSVPSVSNTAPALIPRVRMP